MTAAWRDRRRDGVGFLDIRRSGVSGGAAAASVYVYGEDYLGTARAKIKILNDEIITDLASTTPKIEYSYDRHNVADLQLNGITVDLEDVESDVQEWAAWQFMMHHITFSVRVHTAYPTGIQDGLTNGRLLNSVSNKYRANRDLLDGYRLIEISDFSPREEFSESATLGGELSIKIQVVVQHVQE